MMMQRPVRGFVANASFIRVCILYGMSSEKAILPTGGQEHTHAAGVSFFWPSIYQRLMIAAA